jgi:hypothetical protein
MIGVSCPSCKAPLALRLLPDWYSWAECASCYHPIRTEFLANAGIPQPLIQGLDDWARRSPKLTGIGIDSDFGTGLDDERYLADWKALRDETRTLVAELRTYFEAQADVLIELFEGRSWTDDEIVRWRRQKRRLKLIEEYGGLFGSHYVDIGNPRLREGEPLPIPYPDGFASEEERQHFRSGFELGAAFEPIGIGYDEWVRNVARLEAELGLRPTKKPSGGKVPPDGC